MTTILLPITDHRYLKYIVVGVSVDNNSETLSKVNMVRNVLKLLLLLPLITNKSPHFE